MDKIKIGFVPAHRDPFDEDWAVKMRRRCLDALSRIPGMEIIVPDENLTPNGLVRDDSDADKSNQAVLRKGNRRSDDRDNDLRRRGLHPRNCPGL